MATLIGSKFCPKCDDWTRAEAQRPNHVLHLLLSIVTLGWWLLVWLVLVLVPKKWRCSACGTQAKPGAPVGWRPKKEDAERRAAQPTSSEPAR